MMRVCGLNSCGPQSGPAADSCKHVNTTPTAIQLGDFLTQRGTVLPSHQTQHRTASKPLNFFLSCGASTRFWVMASPYGASRPLIGHTTFGRTPLVEWSAWCTDLYLTADNISQETNLHVPLGFEPIIPASERQQRHALEGAAAGIGSYLLKDK